MNRKLKNTIASKLMLLATISSTSLVFIMAFVLYRKSVKIFSNRSLIDLLLKSSWAPTKGDFGFYPFITSTVLVTGLAMSLSIPLCLLTAIYLSEYAPSKVRGIIKPILDLLSGIPSVVFGLWGVSFVVPIIRDYISQFVGVTTTGYCLLSGGIVLALMVFPIIISVSDEVLRSVPFEVREASFSLGATKWQTVKYAVIRRALPGIIAAIILGFSRAFGETMAVLMVVGNVAKVPSSLFDPAYPLPSLIANNYGEMMSIPLYDSAIMFAALLLMLVISFFSIIARIIQLKIERRSL